MNAPRVAYAILSPAWLMALGILCVFAVVGQAHAGSPSSFRSGEKHDFRGINWGMSRAEVMAREKSRLLTEEDKQGSRVVYFSSQLFGLRADLSYTFTRDKCWYAKYEIKSGAHTDLEDLKQLYAKIEGELHKRYGGPFAVLDQEYDSILGRTWKTGNADISLYLHPAAGPDNRLELSLSFLCRDLMYEVLDINALSPAFGF